MGGGGTAVMNIVFFGTPDYVLPTLDQLQKAKYNIAAVVTQPPKPVGRKAVLTPSPVAQWAQKNKIPVFDQSPKDVPPLKKLNAEVGVLEAYGRILPPDLIRLFPHGIINVHPSLLPKYRGASPVEATIAAGDKQTGVTIIKLDEEMDHGPILSQFTEPILPEDNRVTLRERLFKKSADALVKILPNYLKGNIQLREQNHQEATFTTLMKKDHGFIPPEYLTAALQSQALQGVSQETQWAIPFIKNFTIQPTPLVLNNFIRAVNPWPGAFTHLRLTFTDEQTKKLKILRAHLEELQPKIYKLQPDMVQLEGKNPVTWKQLQQGYPEAKF